MPYVERTDREIASAFRARLEQEPDPGRNGIHIGETSLTLQELMEAMEQGTPIGRRMCELSRLAARNADADPVEQIRTAARL